MPYDPGKCQSRILPVPLTITPDENVSIITNDDLMEKPVLNFIYSDFGGFSIYKCFEIELIGDRAYAVAVGNIVIKM